jgi:exodeoxyribonuclease VII large subunit
MTQPPNLGPSPPANVAEYTVGELSAALRRTLEDGFGYVRVRGEISGFKNHTSGHCYFALKDEAACLDAVCWRSAVRRLSFKPEDGLEVVASGRITTYASRSKYQMIVEHIAPAGVGALMALLEERRRKLAAEGLFAADRKLPLPFLPEVIGVVTSPTGAVIRDILHRLAERFPRRVLVWPVLVQGELAAEQIAAAIEGFNRLEPNRPVPRPDLLIVARGGGSLEDLWAFNEEVVVRAAAASRIPLISAVGHETDTTLIDFAADLRAPTPTAAAELAVPVRLDLMARLRQLDERVLHGIERDLRSRAQQVTGLARGLPEPRILLDQAEQRLDDWAARLPQSTRNHLERLRWKVADLGSRLRSPAQLLQEQDHRIARCADRLALHLGTRLRERAGHLGGFSRRLSLDEIRLRLRRHPAALDGFASRHEHAMERRLRDGGGRLAALSSRLASVSYESVLKRGFALVRDERDRLVSRAEAARSGALLQLQFSDGRVRVLVDEGSRRRPSRSAEDSQQERLL